MRELLQALLDSPRAEQPLIPRQFAAAALAAFAGMEPPTVHVATATILLEPLTAREEEVLRLLASGASNQDIVEQLVISLATAKKHVSNVLGKLGVASRTQAILRARELGLLE
jgi:ATP/maltotriose-dependent transcriptional regulator MalT